MAIIFNCQFCGKEIKASDNAGGKWGKCPTCQKKVYVPSPDADEDLKLAPLDTQFEERERQLMAETYRITQDILQEREVPDGPTKPSGAAYDLSDSEIRKNVILYLRQMAQGNLDEADRTSALIRPFKPKVIEIIDKIALSEIPEPELEDISPSLLSGFIRNLRSKMT
jgi:hypothetical protein